MQNQSFVNDFTLYTLSEGAITVEFGRDINEDTWNRITVLNNKINKHPFIGLYTTVAAYTTLSIFFDPFEVLQNKDLNGTSCLEKISGYIHQLSASSTVAKTINTGCKITIPVCYGGEFGPDLDDVCNKFQLSEQDVIHLHTSVVYKVYMVGFVPGFAYLGRLPAELEMARKPIPHKAIPPGSVGIAGKQTGIYPLETPGGWQIIGRTPLVMFDAYRPQPSVLKAGDEVMFKPVSKTEFKSYLQQ